MIGGELFMAAVRNRCRGGCMASLVFSRRAFAVVGTTPMASMKSLSKTSDKANPVPRFPRKSGERYLRMKRLLSGPLRKLFPFYQARATCGAFEASFVQRKLVPSIHIR